jgi:hypothetical protein
VKGDSANNVYKAATMETGLQVQVPLFINRGDKISVKTEDGSIDATLQRFNASPGTRTNFPLTCLIN